MMFSTPRLRLFRNSPKSQEDWIQLLQRQEALHATETIKWQNILHSAVQLLKKVDTQIVIPTIICNVFYFWLKLQTEQTLGDLLALINLKEFPNPVRVPAEVDPDIGEPVFQ